METIKINEETNKRIEKVLRLGFGYKPNPEIYGYEEELSELTEFSESHKKRQLITKEVLLNWDKPRNNYRILDFECLRTEFPQIKFNSGIKNLVIHIPFNLIRRLPSPESYTRASRSLILSAYKSKDNELLKQLLPTEKSIILKRSKREIAIKKYFASLK